MIQPIFMGIVFACFAVQPALAQNDAASQKENSPEQKRQEDEISINPKLLAPILQPFGIRSMGVRDVERDAYYEILDKARKIGNRKLKVAAAEFKKQRLALPRYERYRTDPSKFPTFIDLFKNPLKYHGKVVTVHGHALKLIDVAAGKNDFGLETVWEVWLYTDDSQNNPVVAVVSSIPDGIPRGQEIRVDNISITGFFFKNYLYEAQDQQRFAPMLLGHKLEWSPPSPPAPPLVPPWITYSLVIVGMTCGVTLLWYISKSDRKSRDRRMSKELGTSTPEFGNISGEAPDESSVPSTADDDPEYEADE